MKTADIDRIIKQMTACGVPQHASPKIETDLFSTTYRDSSKDPITLQHDALALSCCVWRLKSTGGPEHFSFSSNELAGYLVEDDFKHATEIRSYYGKKFMWANLNGTRLSPFRQDLLKFIHSIDPKVITEGTAGMVYRLPAFYQEDITMDNIKETANTSEIQRSEIPNNDSVVELTPITIIKRESKRIPCNVYWFKLPDNRLASVEIHKPNPLEHMWLDIFNNSATIKVKGRFVSSYRENFHFYRIINWTLEK